MINKMKQIITFYKTKKGKTTFFFGFYLIFFFGLFIFISMLDKPVTPNEDKVTSNEIYKFDKLENTSYKEIITIQENNTINPLVDKDNYEYKQLLELINIKKLLKNAKYLNKTMYGDNTYLVNYEITNKTLNELLEKNIVMEDMTNPINLKTDSESNILEIEYDFSNYQHLIKEDIFTYKVLIKYEY